MLKKIFLIAALFVVVGLMASCQFQASVSSRNSSNANASQTAIVVPVDSQINQIIEYILDEKNAINFSSPPKLDEHGGRTVRFIENMHRYTIYYTGRNKGVDPSKAFITFYVQPPQKDYATEAFKSDLEGTITYGCKGDCSSLKNGLPLISNSENRYFNAGDSVSSQIGTNDDRAYWQGRLSKSIKDTLRFIKSRSGNKPDKKVTPTPSEEE